MIEEFDIIDQDYIAAVKKLVGDDFFQHYYFIDGINRVMNGQAQLFDAFIVTEENSWLIGFWITGNYMFYSKNFTEIQMQVIKKRVDFKLFQNGFHFFGSKGVIERIEKESGIEYINFKTRLYYACDKVNYFSENPLYIVEQAHQVNVDELSQMACEYFEDEYHGVNNKNFNEMKIGVTEQTTLGKLWVLKKDNILKSMCSIIPTSQSIPIIGSFFTKRDSRNLGYGKSLLFKVTENLLKNHSQCWLLADESNLSSIKIFEDVGYKCIYKTKDIIVNNN